MRNNIITIGLSVIFFSAISSSAFANTVPSESDLNFGFLEQEKPDWMDAPPVIKSLYPTLLQEVRAANFLVHQIDTLSIGSPSYKQAHRLLLQNLLQMERQLYFNPIELAKFNSVPHPARSTVDQTIYPRNGATSMLPTIINTLSDGRIYYTYIPTRRTLIVEAENRNSLRASR